MSKIPQKTIKKIDQISFVNDILKESERYHIGGVHWTETPPEMWDKDAKAQWDMMNELEMRLKREILNLLT